MTATKAQRILDDLKDGRTWEEVGSALGFSGAYPRKVWAGECQPSLSMRKALGLHRRVDRLAARVTPEQGRMIREELARRGYDSPTNYWLSFVREL